MGDEDAQARTLVVDRSRARNRCASSGILAPFDTATTLVKRSTLKAFLFGVMLLALAIALGAFTTSQYVHNLSLEYLERGGQWQRYLAILNGHAGNPWQYRILAPYLIKTVMRWSQHFPIAQPVATIFIGFRVFQDSCVLLLAYAYYRRLGLAIGPALLGLGCLAWSMSYSQHNSDLQFSTFFDVMFYLLAGWCIAAKRLAWIVPLTLFAALNRETSALIPVLLLSSSIYAMQAGAWRRVLPLVSTAAAVYVAVFLGLRGLYDHQALLVPDGHHIGLDMIKYNLTRSETWSELLVCLGVVPLAAAFSYRHWPMQLKVSLWTIVPLWLAVHTVAAVLAEARLLLVPQALVFIPGALCGLGVTTAADTAPPSQPRRARDSRT